MVDRFYKNMQYYAVSPKDLPFYCPPKNSNLSHPKVFIPFKAPNEMSYCPYCSTAYLLRDE